MVSFCFLGGLKMKKFLKSLFVVACLILTLNIVSVNKSKASVNKSDVVIVKVQENGINYILFYVDGILVMKVEEL